MSGEKYIAFDNSTDLVEQAITYTSVALAHAPQHLLSSISLLQEMRNALSAGGCDSSTLTRLDDYILELESRHSN